MSEDRPYVERNTHERERLRGLVARLTDDDLHRPVTDRWTVADMLGHLGFWDARAFYFDDPAGNIVEIVAHNGIDEFGLSELGLVGDTRAMAAELQKLGLELWDGTVEEEGRLAFVGERGRTLILAPPGRGWMPTGRPAERHPVEAELSGTVDGEVELEGGLYRVGCRRLQA